MDKFKEKNSNSPQSNIYSPQANKVCFMVNYEKLRSKVLARNYSQKKTVSNLLFINPKFKHYDTNQSRTREDESANIVNDRSEYQILLVLISSFIICLWFASMCLLAQSTYPIIQKTIVNKNEEIRLHLK